MDNYSKIYVKTYGSAPFNGNYIRQPELFTLPPSWKEFFIKNTNKDIVNSNNPEQVNNPDNLKYISIGPTQVKLNVPTSSKPQTNLPNGNQAPEKKDIYYRSSRGLPSVYNYGSLSNNPSTAVIGRYTGIYTSARGKSAGTSGPLNPIKHWRKQLIPAQGHITGKPNIDSVVWTPGGTTTLVSNTDTSCCFVNSSSLTNGMLFQYIKNGYTDMSNCNCNLSSDVVRNELSNFQPVYFNNPERVVRPRSSQTKLKKNYYTTGSAYLKSRVKLYEQNQLLSNVNQKISKQLDARLPPSNNNWVYPENKLKEGSQAFNSTYCISDPSACCTYVNNMSKCQIPTTFKPNNPFFAVQGAVDSSTRILQAKYNAITKNNYDFNLSNPSSKNFNPKVGIGMNVYKKAGDPNSGVIALPGSTPMKYRGDSYRSQAPYFIKNKYQKINACNINPFLTEVSTHTKNRLNGIGNRQPSGGTGRITTCFYSSLLSPESPPPEPVSPHTPPQNICCKALTAECLACAAGVSVAEYCHAYPKTYGCSLRSANATIKLKDMINN